MWMLKKNHHNEVNSLWPSDAIWQRESRSTLAQVMARCLTAPSHYLNQCWLIINKVQWNSSEGNFTKDTSAINHWNEFQNYLSKVLFKSPRGQCVNVFGDGTDETFTTASKLNHHIMIISLQIYKLELLVLISLQWHGSFCQLCSPTNDLQWLWLWCLETDNYCIWWWQSPTEGSLGSWNLWKDLGFENYCFKPRKVWDFFYCFCFKSWEKPINSRLQCNIISFKVMTMLLDFWGQSLSEDWILPV